MQGKGLVNGGLGSRFEDLLAENIKNGLSQLPKREHIEIGEIQLPPLTDLSELQYTVPEPVVVLPPPALGPDHPVSVPTSPVVTSAPEAITDSPFIEEGDITAENLESPFVEEEIEEAAQEPIVDESREVIPEEEDVTDNFDHLIDEAAVIDEADVNYTPPVIIESSDDLDDEDEDTSYIEDLMHDGHFEPLGTTTSSTPVIEEDTEDEYDEEDETLAPYSGQLEEDEEDSLDFNKEKVPSEAPAPQTSERVVEREIIREYHYVNGTQEIVAEQPTHNPFPQHTVRPEDVPSFPAPNPESENVLEQIDVEAEEEREVLSQEEKDAQYRKLAQQKAEADFRAQQPKKAPKQTTPKAPKKEPVVQKEKKKGFFSSLFTKDEAPKEAPLFVPDDAALERAAKLSGKADKAEKNAEEAERQPIRVQTADYVPTESATPIVEEKKNSLFTRRRVTPIEDEAGVNPQEWLETTILKALSLNASDLHISVDGETKENLIARIRVDGVMMDFDEVHGVSAKIIMGRLKAATNLSSAGSFEPEETIYEIELDGERRKARAVLFRTHDTGEALVMRLPLTGHLKQLEELNFSDKNLNHFYKLLESPSKMIMIAGPMGSGKTTTAHGAMLHVATDERTVWTIEDPVERTLPGAVQLEIDEENGAGFDVLLSKLLRADYNTLFLGEIRDHATAAAGVRQAKAGRQVMSTIHANNNVTALLRLIELAQDSPLSVLDSVRGVVSQRLVRRLNPDWDGEDIRKKYSGRVPIHEVLFVDDNLIEVMMQNKPLTEIKTAAVQAEGSTFAEDCQRLLAAGITDEEEIRRVIGDNY